MKGIISILCFSLLLFVIDNRQEAKAQTSATAETVNFSEYYPLKKGTYRKYRVTKKGKVVKTFTQVWTEGALYEGVRSVRTSESPIEWDDEAHVDGQTLSFAGSDEKGNVFTFDGPLIKGMEKWRTGDNIASVSTIHVGSLFNDFIIKVTFDKLESLEIGNKVYSKCMKISFSVNNGETSGTTWYARRIGLVKGEYPDGEIWELVDYGALPSSAPSISGIKIEKAEGKKQNLKIVGEGFQAGATVVINGRKASGIIQESSTTITVPKFSGELPEPGQIYVVNPDLQTAFPESSK